jgi:hypothetical protein
VKCICMNHVCFRIPYVRRGAYIDDLRRAVRARYMRDPICL